MDAVVDEGDDVPAAMDEVVDEGDEGSYCDKLSGVGDGEWNNGAVREPELDSC